MAAVANTMASQTIRPTVCERVDRCDMVVLLREGMHGYGNRGHTPKSHKRHIPPVQSPQELS